MINTYIDHHNNSQKSFKKIFSFIVKKGKTTRREIQKVTDYSWSSVSSVVSVLINNNFVYETETINNGIGRNASYIVPNGDKYVCIGLDINSIGFTVNVIGIDGTNKFGAAYPYTRKNKEGILSIIYQAIDDSIAFIGDEYKLVSIGISCQGGTDNNHSTFIHFPFSDDFDNVNLKQIIEEKYGVHTFVEHDTNCLLENYSYYFSSQDESVCVARIVSGIGFAISINGQSLEKYGSIDFGHLIVQPINGPKCMCGLNGCLEAYASSTGIINRANVADFSIIDANREKYREYLDDASFYLGTTLANIKKIFNLDKIVITGNVIGDDDKFLENVISASEKIVGKGNNISYIKDLNAAKGAAILSLKNKVDLKGEI